METKNVMKVNNTAWRSLTDSSRKQNQLGWDRTWESTNKNLKLINRSDILFDGNWYLNIRFKT